MLPGGVQGELRNRPGHVHDGPECPYCGQRSLNNEGRVIACTTGDACMVSGFFRSLEAKAAKVPVVFVLHGPRCPVCRFLGIFGGYGQGLCYNRGCLVDDFRLPSEEAAS